MMRNYSSQLFHTKGKVFWGAIFFSICLAMLIAGLWPLDFRPVNKVSWLRNINGINFYGQAMVSSAPLWDEPVESPFKDKSITIEIWVHPSAEPDDIGIGRILTLYDRQEADNGCIALYTFDERKGTIVHNHTGNNNQLTIPEAFTPLRHIVLSAPWRDLRWDRSSIQDVTMNIVGFIPFGFFCSAFLCKVKRGGKSAVYLNAAVIGLAFSLAIELLQVYIPTRYSQSMDVICNVMGTIIGLAIFHKAILFSSGNTYN